MCLEMLHSLNFSDSIMHFVARPPSLLCICLNTPLLPKHGMFKECHTLTLKLNHCNVFGSTDCLSLCVICLTLLASPTPLTPNVFERSELHRPSHIHARTHAHTHTLNFSLIYTVRHASSIALWMAIRAGRYGKKI